MKKSLPAETWTDFGKGVGLRTVYMPDAKVQHMALLFGCGSQDDPKKREGLTHLAVRMLFESTRKRSTQELAEALEGLGIHCESDVHWENSVLRFSFPPEFLDPALDLMEELLFEPALKEGDFERLRGRQISILSKEFKDSGILASRLVNALLLRGTRQAHPSKGLPDTLGHVAHADLGAQLDALRSRSLTVLLCGNVEDRIVTRMGRLMERFGDGTRPRRGRIHASHAPAVLYFCPRPGSVQSEIRAGNFGPGPAEREHLPAHLLNTLFGGKFTSRLNLNLREKHGFTYGVRSSFLERRKFSAHVITVAVANDVTRPALEELFKEMDAIRDGSPTKEEVVAAAGYLEGSFYYSLDDPYHYLGRVIAREAAGLPARRFNAYLNFLRKARTDGLPDAPRNFLDRSRALFVVVGDPSVLPSVRSLGMPVEEVVYP
jgi:zinc protease